MKSIKKWLQEKKSNARKEGGMREMLEATEMKQRIALAILGTNFNEDRRTVQHPIQEERRREIYNYHQKLA